MGFEVSRVGGSGQSLSPAQSSGLLNDLLPKGNSLPVFVPPPSLPKDFKQSVIKKNSAAIRAKLKNENTASAPPLSIVLKNGGVLGGKDGGANGVILNYKSFEVGVGIPLSGGATLNVSESFVPNRGGLRPSATGAEFRKGSYGVGISIPASGGNPTATLRVPVAGLDGKIEATRNKLGGLDVSVKVEMLP